MTDEEKLDLLATDGMLVKRPILVTEKAVLVGFKESDWEGVVWFWTKWQLLEF